MSFLSKILIVSQALLSVYASPFSQSNSTILHAEPKSLQVVPRTRYRIVTSCFATLFLCTWIVVHPNIPAERDGKWRVLVRRFAIMIYLILVPELVIWWAARQHYAAKFIERRCKSDHGWTRTHGFFAVMGGFALYEPDTHKFIKTLELTELESLCKTQQISWPYITEEQIADRSKADYLSKGFVLLQTGWFIGGCIGRGVQGLPLTEMEVMTLAFAVLNVIVYWLWWDKPMDVMRPFPVYKTFSTQADQPTHSEQVVSQQSNPAVESHGADSPPTADSALITPQLSSPSGPPVSLPFESDLQVSAFHRLLNLLREERQERGWLRGCGYMFYLPFANFFQAFDDMISLDKLRSHLRRVPTFYSPALTPLVEDGADDPETVGQSLAVLVAIFVELLFGGIHCMAWNNTFPSNLEKWLWRISAVLILTLPLSMTVLSPVLADDDADGNLSYLRRLFDTFVEIFLLIGVFFYFVARLALLVLPFLQLRDLPPRALLDIQWVSLFPHIS